MPMVRVSNGGTPHIYRFWNSSNVINVTLLEEGGQSVNGENAVVVNGITFTIQYYNTPSLKEWRWLASVPGNFYQAGTGTIVLAHADANTLMNGIAFLPD